MSVFSVTAFGAACTAAVEFVPADRSDDTINDAADDAGVTADDTDDAADDTDDAADDTDDAADDTDDTADDTDDTADDTDADCCEGLSPEAEQAVQITAAKANVPTVRAMVWIFWSDSVSVDCCFINIYHLPL